MSDVIAARRKEIECCESIVASSLSRSSAHNDFQDFLEKLRRELDDWTWPTRLADNPRLAWARLWKGRYMIR